MSKREILLGTIVKPFGIKGEVKLAPSEDFWEGVLSSSSLYLNVPAEGGETRRELTLKNSRSHQRSYLLTLEGVEDRTSAESLVGASLCIAEEDIDVTMPSEPLPFQVMGCTVRTTAGEEVGVVEGILFSRAHRIYEVKGPRGWNLVPAVDEFIVSIDLEAKEMVIRTIPGLLDDGP